MGFKGGLMLYFTFTDIIYKGGREHTAHIPALSLFRCIMVNAVHGNTYFRKDLSFSQLLVQPVLCISSHVFPDCCLFFIIEQQLVLEVLEILLIVFSGLCTTNWAHVHVPELLSSSAQRSIIKQRREYDVSHSSTQFTWIHYGKCSAWYHLLQ